MEKNGAHLFIQMLLLASRPVLAFFARQTKLDLQYILGFGIFYAFGATLSCFGQQPYFGTQAMQWESTSPTRCSGGLKVPGWPTFLLEERTEVTFSLSLCLIIPRRVAPFSL